jgi:hypothetical protein
MKTFVALGLCLIFVSSCRGPAPQSRFQFARASLTVYHWSTQAIVERRDTLPQFHLWRQIQVDSSGLCRIVRRDEFFGPLSFFQLPLPSAAEPLLNGLEKMPDDTTYLPPRGTVASDESPFRRLIIEDKDGKNHIISYTPDYLPAGLRQVHELMDSLSFSAHADTTNPFDYQTLTSLIVHRDSWVLQRSYKMTPGEPIQTPDPEAYVARKGRRGASVH